MKEKKHTSIDNQLEKLKGRNITIDQHEEKEIKKILERNNYYNVINAVCGKINVHTIAAQKYTTPQAA